MAFPASYASKKFCALVPVLSCEQPGLEHRLPRPFIAYDNPFSTKVKLPPAVLADLADHRPACGVAKSGSVVKAPVAVRLRRRRRIVNGSMNPMAIRALRVLIIGGTGLISGAITRKLLSLGHEVTHFHRGHSAGEVQGAGRIQGDRRDHAAFEGRLREERFDAVIDMICFDADDARSAVRAFADRVDHFIFCSTVCVCGVRVPPSILVTEDDPCCPVSDYARGKLDAEQVFWDAFHREVLPVTILRPTRVYGPTQMVRHNTGGIDSTWDRLEQGRPILCSGDGLGLFQPCHCEEVALAFVHALGRGATFGQAYNVVHRDAVTWREFYGRAAAAMGQPARILYAPASWIIARNPQRFHELETIFQYHGVYSSEKIRRDIPEFTHHVELTQGLGEALQGMKGRGEWPRWQEDDELNRIIGTVQGWGVEPDLVDCRGRQ